MTDFPRLYQSRRQGARVFPHPDQAPSGIVISTAPGVSLRCTNPLTKRRPAVSAESFADTNIIVIGEPTAEVPYYSPRRQLPTAQVRRVPLLTPPATALMTLADIYPWLRRIQSQFPDRMVMQAYGSSAQGRPIMAVQITPPGVNLAQLRRLAIICRQHGDEPETTAAGAEFIYRALMNKLPGGQAYLQRVALLIIPVANPDGAVVKTRRNALQQDLNRDWGYWSTPEATTMAQLIQSWRPDLIVDVHQWVPGDAVQTPMAEASGGNLSRQAAATMVHRARARGYRLGYRTREAEGSLAHRYWASQGTPAILLETIHRPGSARQRSIAINTSVVALQGALEVLSTSIPSRPWWM